MHILFGLLSGLVFGIGLVISGMSNPAKVLNFLDVAGTWDPSLAFVMGGASVTTFIGYRLILKRPTPALADMFQLPTAAQVDPSLLLGSALFGIGWGIGGFCPGPAWTALPMMSPGILVFLPMMLLGLWIGSHLKLQSSGGAAPAAS